MLNNPKGIDAKSQGELFTSFRQGFFKLNSINFGPRSLNEEYHIRKISFSVFKSM